MGRRRWRPFTDGGKVGGLFFNGGEESGRKRWNWIWISPESHPTTGRMPSSSLKHIKSRQRPPPPPLSSAPSRLSLSSPAL
ncbi:hypothetical protein OPV22_010738 [Ensete ventricosum]|uniref:Uncharacterized protein n=1 Tax=Ensete ventricosum TaxID=4639 RepID=A0AAV8RLI2_ENSVE|nr:hypothetical protein OPV22_010738 [Ensete ventricosum]